MRNIDPAWQLHVSNIKQVKPFTNYQKQDCVIFIKLILPMKCIKLQLKRGKTNVQKDINKSGGRTDFSVSGKLRSFQTGSCINK